MTEHVELASNGASDSAAHGHRAGSGPGWEDTVPCPQEASSHALFGQ